MVKGPLDANEDTLLSLQSEDPNLIIQEKAVEYFWDILEFDVANLVREFFLSGSFPKGCQYKIIGKILANRLSMVIGSCVSPEQSAFIKGRNILDVPLILNEVMGFLCNARSSILVNGSPTSEFELYMGLHQGDPLSPFLFILAMKGLYVLTCKAIDMRLFKGALIRQGNMTISHLIYVDDVLFIGEWSQANIHNLLCMLRCFYLVSGLKININKCNVLGVYVSHENVANMAKVIGCGAAKLPLKYLGIPIGCNMARVSNWNTIVQRFSSKLSEFKARLLSVGGRLSLIKSILENLPTYYMSIYMMPVSIQKELESMRNKFFIGGDEREKKITWVKWKKCLASKNLGGLGVGSINDESSYSPSYNSWSAILSSVKRIKKKANRIHLVDWCAVLRRLPRGGVELSQFNSMLFSLGNVDLSDKPNSWLWSLDASTGFSVSSVRSFIDANTLDVDTTAFLPPLKKNATPLEVALVGPFDIGVDEVSSAIDDVFDIGKARGVDEDELIECYRYSRMEVVNLNIV
ncbi:putative RNA-directed DNA polymerase, eukaryota, reverse transcriptase zinc-binding domain protein [Tanacetum coccineum]